MLAATKRRAHLIAWGGAWNAGSRWSGESPPQTGGARLSDRPRPRPCRSARQPGTERSAWPGTESLFVIGRNQRSTLSEYGPVAVLHRLSPKATRRTLRKRVAVGDRKVPVRVVTCGYDLGRVLGLGAQPGPCGAESGDALISLVCRD